VSERTKRVDELLRQEIGAIIAREIADPRIGFVTITDVETTPDLRHAKVWVSVIGSAAERDAAMTSLAHAMPFIRHELGSRLRIRRIPELHVRADDTLERGSRVLHLLNELEAGTDPADLPAEEESLPTPVMRLPHEGDAPEPIDGTPEEPIEAGRSNGDARRFRGGARRAGSGGPRSGAKSGTRPGARPKPRRGGNRP
jgi:ribosome-binding factor A